MASVKFDPKAGKARIFFRHEGRQYNVTLRDVASKAAAEGLVGDVEATLRKIKSRKLTIPAGADVARFVITDGAEVIVPEPEPVEIPKLVETVGQLLDAYRDDPPLNLEESTVAMQGYHRKHLIALIGGDPLAGFKPQKYVKARLAMTYRGRATSRVTVGKELATLRACWRWVAKNHPEVPPSFTQDDYKLPKVSKVGAFRSWSEIEREIQSARRLGRPIDEDELWESLWLEKQQVREFLAHAKTRATQPGVYAMLAACALTGARRSELCRSDLRDWRLDSGRAILQERKGTHNEQSEREVPIHPELAGILREWFDAHPGGTKAFCTDRGKPISWDMAKNYFSGIVAGSKWDKLKGWHVLRHSFASNLAASGADQRIIDLWMGHKTSIRERYMHLRRVDQESAINLL